MLTNNGAQRKLGYTASQLSKMTLPDVMPLLCAETTVSLLAPLLSGAEREIVFETTLQGQDQEYPAQVRLQYLGDEEPPIVVRSPTT